MGLPDPNRIVLTNTLDTVVVNKEQKAAVVIDVSVPSDNNLRKKEYEKLGKYQSLKEELERMWNVKAKVVSIVVGALKAVTTKLGE